MIPALVIDPIVNAARAELYDIAALGEAAVLAGNVAIPLIAALTAEVAKSDHAAAGYVHWGATSQDVIDTALVLELRAAIDALIADLNRAIEAFTTLAGRHRRTAAVARTWMQHALPMPFGLQLAGYAAALGARASGCGGCAGRRSSCSSAAPPARWRRSGNAAFRSPSGSPRCSISPQPEAPWHTHRDRLGEVAAAFAILVGTCGKIARDVSLMMQTDVAEAFEPAAPGRGSSSTMPQKRNPTAAAVALAAATIAPNLLATILAGEVQEHERALGGWQAEWPTFPALALVTSGALHAIVDIAQGLEVDSERMRVNLGATRGLIMAEAVTFALAAKVGKHAAHKCVEDACRRAMSTKRDLQVVLGDEPLVRQHLNTGELAKLFEPLSYQGVAQNFIDRIVGALQTRTAPKRP